MAAPKGFAVQEIEFKEASFRPSMSSFVKITITSCCGGTITERELDEVRTKLRYLGWSEKDIKQSKEFFERKKK